MIRFANVVKRYQTRQSKGHEALSALNLEIDKGEWVFLAGHSGAGKSTLLKLIALLERPTRGQLFINDRNVGRLPVRQVPKHRQNIGMVWQDHQLLYDRSVFDNVALPLVVQSLRPKDIARRVRAALDQVDLLRYEQHWPMSLSTGEQQRVGIARAIVHRPAMLLADEPTGNLDPMLSLDIMRLFKRFHDIGTTILIATHDVDLIKQFKQRILVLKDGGLVADTRFPEVQQRYEQTWVA